MSNNRAIEDLDTFREPQRRFHHIEVAATQTPSRGPAPSATWRSASPAPDARWVSRSSSR